MKIDCKKIVAYKYSNPPTLKDNLFNFLGIKTKKPFIDLPKTITGLDAGNRKIYKFLDKYNQFDKNITEIPKNAKKITLERDYIDDYICGNKVPLKSDKKLLSKYSKDKYYFTLDNGGNPFCVYCNSKYVDVFRVPKNMKINTDDKLTKYHYTQKIASFKPKKIFIGKSPKTEMTLFSGGYGKRFDGNSILLELEKNKYIFIGMYIYEFTALSNITHFISPVGNSGTTFPYAIDDKNNIYLLSFENIILLNIKDKLEEPYGFYDDNKTKIKTKKLKFKKIYDRL